MKQFQNRITAGFLAMILFAGLCFGCVKEPAPEPQNDPGASLSGANLSFDEDLAGWTISADTTSGAVSRDGGGHDGNGSLLVRSESGFTAEVTTELIGLEPGDYVLTAFAKQEGGFDSAYLFANGSSKSPSMTAIPISGKGNDDMKGWTRVTLRGIRIEDDGKLRIGLHADASRGATLRLDDLELQKTAEIEPFLIGGDLSALPYLESKRTAFFDEKWNVVDPVVFLRENGWNFARIRLYNDPGPGHGDGTYYIPEGFFDLDDALAMAKRVKNAGMEFELTFHYSDFWTNGGMQNVPAAWKAEIEGLSENEAAAKLASLIHRYTMDVLMEMQKQRTLPLIVTLGNETQGGMLYPYGEIEKGHVEDLARFYIAGYEAVKEVSQDIRVFIHLDDAGNTEQYRWYFREMKRLGVAFDGIAASYYPYWSKKTVAELVSFSEEITREFSCPLLILETGFNWNPLREDGYFGQLKDNGPYEGVYPSTPEGQRDFLIDLMNGLKGVPGGQVIGDVYWDPVFVAQYDVGWACFESNGKTDVNVISNTTLFDFEHRALPALEAYRRNSDGE